jgi:ABC-type amino acid transport substrate-binding protein
MLSRVGWRPVRLAVLLPAIVAGPPGVTAADLDAIAARGALRVLVGAGEEPVWFGLKGGDAPGFEREVLEGFARLHKLRFEAVVVEDWAEAIPTLLQGHGDLLAGVNDTPARRRQVDFTAELLPARNVVVTRRPQAPVLTAGELRAARFAVVPHTTWAEALEKAGVPASRRVAVEDVEAAFDALRAGRATATVTDVLDFLLQRRRDGDLQAGMALGGALSSAWAVRKTDPQLRRALDAYLVALRAGPNWSRLLVKYFGEDAPAVLGRAPSP